MGEVYRARDTRLGREVAIKVLPTELAADRERLKRFEKEARSASSLNHPSIVTIYEIGQADSVSYIAMELVEGKTLRDLVASGSLPVKRLLQIGTQVAEGLARAHEAGIVHRDLKPENLMVTKDGLVKILDFGLAKLTYAGPGSGAETNLPTQTATTPGVVMGTVSYMSPEQASGQSVDYRSDQFSLGSILYEMVTGVKPFRKDNAAEIMAAIIRDEPAPISQLRAETPAPLCWTIERCLSKEPRGRYSSTEDLARELQTLRDHLSQGVEPIGAASPPRRVLRWPWIAGTVLAVAALVAGLARTRSAGAPSFQPVTFPRGSMGMARFASDGKTIVYSVTSSGADRAVFLTRTGNPESRLLFPDADLFSVSRFDELAIMPGGWKRQPNLLSRVPLAGGTPREVAENIAWSNADWAPDGQRFAVVRSVAGRNRLEFPIGTVLYETGASLSAPRFSPDGRLLALFERKSLTNGSVMQIGSDGKGKKVASDDWFVLDGVPCWAKSGKEIWFTAARKGDSTALFAVTPSGRLRQITHVPGDLELYDISSTGQVLLARHTSEEVVLAVSSPEEIERDLSWLDFSLPSDVSPDGKTLLMSEIGKGGGPDFSVYLRQTDGSPAKRLGDGMALTLSPDGKWAMAKRASRLWLLPTGPGESRELGGPAFDAVGGAAWFPDGKRVVFSARETGKGERLYVQTILGGQPRPISPEGVTLRDFGGSVSPDGRFVLGLPASEQMTLHPEQRGKPRLYRWEGGEPREIPGLQDGELPIQWSLDGRSLFVYKRGSSRKVWLLDNSDGSRQLWKEVRPATGLGGVKRLLITPDGRSYVYNSSRPHSELYIAEGLN